jgi:hypothetical protein
MEGEILKFKSFFFRFYCTKHKSKVEQMQNILIDMTTFPYVLFLSLSLRLLLGSVDTESEIAA